MTSRATGGCRVMLTHMSTGSRLSTVDGNEISASPTFSQYPTDIFTQPVRLIRKIVESEFRFNV